MLSLLKLEENFESSVLSLKTTILDLKNKTNILIHHENELNNKLEILNNRDTLITDRENNIFLLENKYIEKLQKLDIREKQIAQEQEDGRKVSILKNIQIQLSQKTSECELLNKQLIFYKSRCEFINNLCNKYNVSIESLDLIIEKMLNKKDEIIEIQPKKIELTNQELKNVDTSKERSCEKEIKKNNPKIEETIIEKSNDAIQEESIEVDIFNYKGKQYYIDNNSGDIYAKLEDDEVGDIIGYRNEKGIVKFGLRKK